MSSDRKAELVLLFEEGKKKTNENDEQFVLGEDKRIANVLEKRKKRRQNVGRRKGNIKKKRKRPNVGIKKENEGLL
jgi:hypothetical protein